MSLTSHPDRLLPADPGTRAVARRLHHAVRDLPIISPHGHVDPRLLLDDAPFTDPVSLFVQPDHYVTRLLHAGGVPLNDLGIGAGPLPQAHARQVWRLLCGRWDLFRGTPVRYWLETALSDVFGISDRPGTGNADDLYDRIATRLAQDSHRPRAMLDRFGIEFLATTDDPADDLTAHAALAEAGLRARIVPTFRPDRYLETAAPGWADTVKRLGAVADTDIGQYHGFLAALENRRRHFIAHGAVSTDHSHADAAAEPLPLAEAARIYARALSGEVLKAEATAFRRHMILEMARMSCEDGLVMTLHPAIARNHHPPTFDRFGPDTGHDIPTQVEFTRALRPLLTRFGTHPGFHLVLFTTDPTVYSREIAPLASFYPSVYAGVPWWFLDNPSEIRAFQRSVTEIAGFSRLSGFIDDTRAFLSIPARHDMARRLDAGHLAELVVAHRLDEDEALDTLTSLVSAQPRKVFKL
ncbi:glucuronate isomerase [Actinoplanes derwentensis]|uniref:Uronate isomerase n=1 Tax=Actinoplanes derwentensis TaxID=113562 RepID=A0A1H1XH78_9ACTN|nr:glucuronate isomerase [Actinoplanes derwentensis]GID87183.1 uronate isomerase [Actinoplanes derwentensis]SDT08481.1 glucuronate isomerase [Actinoplanes derwentensis]